MEGVHHPILGWALKIFDFFLLIFHLVSLAYQLSKKLPSLLSRGIDVHTCVLQIIF
jgi:hypothetical protein